MLDATLSRRGLVTAALAAGAIALWPASETDKARDDGEALGTAVNHLYYADSSAEVDTALAEIDTAVADTRAHVDEEISGQVDDQADALSRAADGFFGTHTSEDAFEVDVYQAELNTALDDLADEAEQFRTTGPEAAQAFYEGVHTGLSAE
jgi:hypothetical protein